MKRLPSISCRCATPMAVLAMATVVLIAASPAQPATTMSQCRTITDPAARLHCYESLESQGPSLPSAGSRNSSSSVQMFGEWRLVRTNPRGEKDAISITRGGELYGSDPDFAGLMIRCADDGIDVLLVLLRPLPPGTRPQVAVNGKRFEGSVLPPGTIVRLPKEVARSANQYWPALSILSLVINQSGTVIKGLVSLKGFDPALQALTATCSAQ